MQVIVNLMNLALAPIVMLLTVFSGIAVACVSAYLEISVFADFLSVEKESLSYFIPIVIVVGFESSKLLSHLFLSKINSFQTKSSVQLSKHKLYSRLAVFFTSVSFVASLFFVYDNMYMPGYDQKEVDAIQSRIEQIDAKITSLKEQSYDPGSDPSLEPYRAAVEQAAAILERWHTDDSVYLSALESAVTNLENATQRSRDMFSVKQNDQIVYYENLRNQLVQQISFGESTTAQQQYNNELLHRILSLWSTTLFSKPYSQAIYLMFASVIAFILSIGSELVIKTSMDVLASSSELSKLFLVDDAVECKLQYHQTISTFVSSATGITIFILIGTLFMGSINTSDCLAGGLSVLVSLPFMRMISPKTEAAQSTIIKRAFNFTGRTLVGSFLSVGIFILVGFINRSSELSSQQTLALSIGAAAGSLVDQYASR